MKKLNRKGFTLVELLAVIVILAIVVGIAIPGINGVIQGAKGSALNTTVKAAADWLQDQVDMYNLVSTSADSNFTKLVPSTIKFDGKAVELKGATADHRKLLNAMGLTSDKVTNAKVCLTSNGKVYVEVTQVNPKGEYYTTENWGTNGAPNYTTSDVTSINRAGNAIPDVSSTTKAFTTCS